MVRRPARDRILITAILACWTTIPGWAQEPRSDRPLLRPTIGLGGSIFEYDVGGEQAWRGYLARVGLQAGSVADVMLTGQLWPELAFEQQGRSLLLEVHYSLVASRRVAPYVLFGIGAFRAHDLDGTVTESGPAKALGLGFQVRPLRDWGLDVAGVVRIDNGNGDDELRAALFYAPHDVQPPSAARVARPVSAQLGWLVPITGPWRFVEPAYVLTMARAIRGRHATSLSMMLVHWQIPSGNPRGYEWDTRAAIMLPAWRWFSNPAGARRPYLQAGPLLSVMLEGPDCCFRGGVHTGAGYDWGISAIGLSASLTLIWLVRNDERADQRSMLFQIGVGF